MKKGTRLSFSPPAASSRSRQRGDPRRAAHTPPRRAGQPHTVFSPCTVRIAFSHPKSWLVKHDGCDDTSVPARSRPAARLFTTCGYRSHRRSHHNPPSIDTLTVSLPHRIPCPCTPTQPAGVKSATLALVIAACLGGAHAAQITLRSTTAFITDAASDVTAELLATTKLYTMKTALDGTASGRTTARDAYDNNVKILFTATSGTVRTAFDSVYGTEFGTDFVTGMLDAALTDTDSEKARDELFEKTMMDMVVMHLVLDKINANTDRDKWDEAAAYYIGDTTSAFSTYDRANKRARAVVDFGTTVTSGDAAINEAIITALKYPNVANQELKIIELFQVLYLQNVLKYAYEIDTELGEADTTQLSEIVGEGLAFWRVLKPWLRTADSTGAATLDGMFDIDNIATAATPTVQGARHWNYCRAKVIVDVHMTTLTKAVAAGVTLGTYAPVTADGTLCPPFIPTGLAEAYTVGGVTYTFANDVGASLQFSEAIADIKSMLTNGDSMANVAAAYTNLGLRGLADLPRIADADGYTLFNAEHGSVTWISDLMDLALASPNTWVPKLSARNEIIEKTLMDALAVQCIHDDLAHAATAADKRLFFDHAAAKFLGTSTARGSTVFARGNKRGLNYGTTAPDGENSAASLAILTALKTGAAATTDTARAAQIAIVTRQIKIIYSQATLRYAKLVNDDLAENNPFAEHQAEGMAFFNVIRPWVKESSVSDATVAVLDQIFDVQTSPESYDNFAYCVTKKAIDEFVGTAYVSLLGVLEDVTADGTTCAATLPSGTSIVTDTDTYSGAADLGASLSFSSAVMKTLDQLDEPPFTKVLASFKSTGISGAGDEARVGEPVYDLFKAYFGANWMTTYVTAAADNEKTPTSSSAARVEIIEKTIRDAVATQLILSDLYRGTLGLSDAHDKHWDHGAAKYLGTDGDRSVTVYNRAEKRAENFGTLTDNTAGEPEADANYAVIAALKAGKTATTAAQRVAQYNVVKRQIQLVYSQCVLRYANYLDAAFLDRTDYAEHQAEGQAFWRVIAPFVKQVNANGATFLTGVFDLSREVSEHTHYCRAKTILSDLGLAFGEDTEGGSLTGIRNDNCDGVEVPEDATEYLAKAPSSGAAPKFGVALASVVAAAALALAL